MTTTLINDVTETATIFEDRTNSFDLILQKNAVNLTVGEMDAITKYELRYDDTYYDSTTYPNAFSAVSATATLTIFPYDLGLGTSGKRGEVVELIIYDAGDNVEGLVWDQFALIVKADANVPPTTE